LVSGALCRRVWGLVDRVFVLWPTLAVLRFWDSGVASVTLWLVWPLCGNVEWGRRPNTRSTSRVALFFIYRLQV